MDNGVPDEGAFNFVVDAALPIIYKFILTGYNYN